jgi:hypothetical protein
MKSEITGSKQSKEKSFPKLMKLDDRLRIVLFKEKRKGTLVYDKEHKEDLGEYSETYIMSRYVDFKGEIKLKN